jgi:retinol dehydrogenase-12
LSLTQNKAKVEFIELDLADLDSVKRCADTFLARNLPLHLLIANAGLAGQKGMTASGFELCFGVCHVGHFLLVKLLTPVLIASAPARVVVVASKAHRHAKGIDFNAINQPTQSMGGLREYSVAKLANVLFVKELARRLYGTGVTAYAVHPGVVATNVWRSLPAPFAKLAGHWMLTPEQGATTTLHCATHPAAGAETGLYYDHCKVTPSSMAAQDIALARELWQQSDVWVSPMIASSTPLTA